MQGSAYTLSGVAALLPHLAATFLALPVAFLAFGLTQVALASAVKSYLIGRIVPGTHKCAPCSVTPHAMRGMQACWQPCFTGNITGLDLPQLWAHKLVSLQ